MGFWVFPGRLRKTQEAKSDVICYTYVGFR
jgi:hypothetical protein